jgi:hypothetical protein
MVWPLCGRLAVYHAGKVPAADSRYALRIAAAGQW